MTPRNADEADSSQTTKMSVQCSMHMGRCSISTWTPLHAVSTFVLSTIQCPEPQAPKPASSIEEHARKLQQPQHQQDDSDLWLHNCQSKSMGRKLLPLCCACLLLLALHPYMTRSDFIVNAVCHCRLPSPSASLHPHSHPTPSPSPSPPPSPCPMSQVLCPCPSRSSSIFAMILSSSEVMSLPWLCCRAHGYPPFETPVPHPCATTAVTWVQLFF